MGRKRNSSKRRSNTRSSSKKKRARRTARGSSRRRLWLWIAAIGIVSGLCVLAFDLAPTTSRAMEPAVGAGDVVLVDRVGAELSEPDVGDVVLIRNPDDRARELMVRVVAVEDDVVSTDAAEGMQINGEPVVVDVPSSRWKAETRPEDEQIAARAIGSIERARRARLPDGTEHRVLVRSDSLQRGGHADRIEVPSGHVYVLGDNRDASYDSRSFGPVPIGDVVGRVRLVVRTRDADGGLIGRWLRLP